MCLIVLPLGLKKISLLGKIIIVKRLEASFGLGNVVVWIGLVKKKIVTCLFMFCVSDKKRLTCLVK